MSAFDEARRDDEIFSARLQAVNQEMDAILMKTSRTRHDLERTSAQTQADVPLDGPLCDRNSPHAAAYATPYGHSWPRLINSSAAGEPPVSMTRCNDLTRHVVAAEVNLWVRTHLPALVAPLVDTQVLHLQEKLRDHVESLRLGQSELEKTLKDTAEQLRAHRRDMYAALSSAQGEVQRDLQEHRNAVERQYVRWGDELRALREEVGGMKQSNSSTCDRHAQLHSEAHQRQQAHMQEMWDRAEHEQQRWRQTTQQALRKDLQSMEAQQEEIARQVAQLRGALTATADIAAHGVTEGQRLVQDAVGRDSEVRTCRRDVNRLEMLVHCAALQVGSPFAPLATAATAGLSAASADSTVPLGGLVQSVMRLSDSLDTVKDRVEGLDRQVQLLDTAVARAATQASAPASYFSVARGAEKESSHSRSRSYTSTRPPSYCRSSTARVQHGEQTGLSPTITPLPSTLDAGSVTSPLRSAGVALQGSSSSSGSHRFLTSAVFQTRTMPLQESGSSLLVRREEQQPAFSSASEGRRRSSSRLTGGSSRFGEVLEDLQPTSATVQDPLSSPYTAAGEHSFRGDAIADEGKPPLQQANLCGLPAENARQRSASTRGGEAPPSSAARAAPADSVPLRRGSTRDTLSVSSHIPEPSSVPSSPYSSSPRLASAGSHAIRREGLHRSRDRSSSSSPDVGHEGGALPERELRGNHRTTATSSVAAPAHSPSDSYVSDTPPPAPDSKGTATEAPERAPPTAAQYAPAQGSDSESERDNHIMARSALD